MEKLITWHSLVLLLRSFFIAPESSPRYHIAFGHAPSLVCPGLWQHLSLFFFSKILIVWGTLVRCFVDCPWILNLSDIFLIVNLDHGFRPSCDLCVFNTAFEMGFCETCCPLTYKLAVPNPAALPEWTSPQLLSEKTAPLVSSSAPKPPWWGFLYFSLQKARGFLKSLAFQSLTKFSLFVMCVFLC